LAPLELLKDLIPIIGEITDITKITAMLELINIYIKGVKKEGKAKFKVFGKEHSLKVSNTFGFLAQFFPSCYIFI
jgi:chitinase